MYNNTPGASYQVRIRVLLLIVMMRRGKNQVYLGLLYRYMPVGRGTKCPCIRAYIVPGTKYKCLNFPSIFQQVSRPRGSTGSTPCVECGGRVLALLQFQHQYVPGNNGFLISFGAKVSRTINLSRKKYQQVRTYPHPMCTE